MREKDKYFLLCDEMFTKTRSIDITFPHTCLEFEGGEATCKIKTYR